MEWRKSWCVRNRVLLLDIDFARWGLGFCWRPGLLQVQIVLPLILFYDPTRIRPIWRGEAK